MPIHRPRESRDHRSGSSTIEISIEDEPADATRSLILEGLRRYNRRHAEPPDWAPLTLAARDAANTVIGGLVGEIGWKWLHVSLLWVDEACRGRGAGRRLLRTAEREAVRRGCGHSYLDTLDFQALPFYENEGYAVFGVLEGYPPGHRQFYLRKSLADVGQGATPAAPEVHR